MCHDLLVGLGGNTFQVWLGSCSGLSTRKISASLAYHLPLGTVTARVLSGQMLQCCWHAVRTMGSGLAPAWRIVADMIPNTFGTCGCKCCNAVTLSKEDSILPRRLVWLKNRSATGEIPSPWCDWCKCTNDSECKASPFQADTRPRRCHPRSR
ncbi:hypothetical protein VTK73DRAFT_2865 [Phialemonium thermophilum]|uniref:Uncharacterized protein n=1 Tax=Phialemonium thermophilum TaxID=223376 RepID=A0ABR3VP68_9PEZI